MESPVWDVVRYFFIGLFGNLFLPTAIGGDIIKILGLCKGSAQKTRVVASVLLDRLSGFAGIVLLAIVSYMFGFQLINDSSLAISVLILGGVSLGIAGVLFNERLYAFGCQVFNMIPKIKSALMQIHYDIALLKGQKRQGFKAIGIAIFGQIAFSFTFFLVAKALHQDLSIYYFIVFVPLICVISIVPSIGGLGVREAGAVFLFTKVGMEGEVALSMSLLVFLYMVIVGLIGGAIYVFSVSSGRVQHNSQDARLPTEQA